MSRVTQKNPVTSHSNNPCLLLGVSFGLAGVLTPLPRGLLGWGMETRPLVTATRSPTRGLLEPPGGVLQSTEPQVGSSLPSLGRDPQRLCSSFPRHLLGDREHCHACVRMEWEVLANSRSAILKDTSRRLQGTILLVGCSPPASPARAGGVPDGDAELQIRMLSPLLEDTSCFWPFYFLALPQIWGD